LDEFVDHAKKNPQKLKWGHSGRGNLWWTIGTTFSKVAKIQMLDVPFQGDGPNMAALLGGHVDMSILTCGARAIGQIKANKIKPLAITVPQRHHLVPDVANVDELGYALGIPAPYLGTFVRSGTPKGIVSKLSESIGKVTENPDYKKKLEKLGMPIWYRKTEDFSKLVRDFGQVQFRLLKELGVLK
jgi:tripartite-type tricarboxylate transporter receptor subunit TctC